MAQYIANGKNLKIKTIDSNFNTKQITYCPKFIFWNDIFYNFVNIGIVNIIFSHVEVSAYKSWK